MDTIKHFRLVTSRDLIEFLLLDRRTCRNEILGFWIRPYLCARFFSQTLGFIDICCNVYSFNEMTDLDTAEVIKLTLGVVK